MYPSLMQVMSGTCPLFVVFILLNGLQTSRQAIHVCDDSEDLGPRPPDCPDDCAGRRYFYGRDGDCKMCVQCHPGYQHDKYCGDGLNGDALCVPCPEGYYSYNVYDCLACRVCENTKITQECAPDKDRQCGACLLGFYRDPQNHDLCNQRCEWLSNPETIPECQRWLDDLSMIKTVTDETTTGSLPPSGNGISGYHLTIIISVVIIFVLILCVLIPLCFVCKDRKSTRSVELIKSQEGYIENGDVHVRLPLLEIENGQTKLYNIQPAMAGQSEDDDEKDSDKAVMAPFGSDSELCNVALVNNSNDNICENGITTSDPSAVESGLDGVNGPIVAENIQQNTCSPSSCNLPESGKSNLVISEDHVTVHDETPSTADSPSASGVNSADEKVQSKGLVSNGNSGKLSEGNVQRDGKEKPVSSDDVCPSINSSIGSGMDHDGQNVQRTGLAWNTNSDNSLDGHDQIDGNKLPISNDETCSSSDRHNDSGVRGLDETVQWNNLVSSANSGGSQEGHGQNDGLEIPTSNDDTDGAVGDQIGNDQGQRSLEDGQEQGQFRGTEVGGGDEKWFGSAEEETVLHCGQTTGENRPGYGMNDQEHEGRQNTSDKKQGDVKPSPYCQTPRTVHKYVTYNYHINKVENLVANQTVNHLQGPGPSAGVTNLEKIEEGYTTDEVESLEDEEENTTDE